MKAVLFILIVAAPGTALAHGGGLDSKGCHHNRKNGGYHCHRSAPAIEPIQERFDGTPPHVQPPSPQRLIITSPPVRRTLIRSARPPLKPVIFPPIVQEKPRLAVAMTAEDLLKEASFLISAQEICDSTADRSAETEALLKEYARLSGEARGETAEKASLRADVIAQVVPVSVLCAPAPE